MDDKFKELERFIQQSSRKHPENKSAFSAILRKFLDYFLCDRAWVLYPCDPDSPFWGIPFEETRYAWPGANNYGIDIPMKPDEKKLFIMALETPDAIAFGSSHKYPIPEFTGKAFGVKSQLLKVLRPATTKPCLLGIHYCEKDHFISDAQIGEFTRIGDVIEKSFPDLQFSWCRH